MSASSIEMGATARETSHNEHENDIETPDVHCLSLLQCVGKLITFELALKRPWLEEFACETRETYRFRDNCATSLHSSAKRLLNWIFALSTLRLARLSPEAPLNKFQLGLSQERPRKRPAPLWRSASNGLMALALAVLCYITIWIFVTSCVVLMHDIMLTNRQAYLMAQPHHSENHTFAHHFNQNLSSQAQQMATKMADCAFKQQIKTGPKFSERRFIELNEWLDFLGMPVRSQLGVNFIAIAIICSGPLVFYLLPVLFVLTRGHHIRLDAVAFLYEPARERRRLANEQSQILAEMVSLFESTCHEGCQLLAAPLTAPNSKRPLERGRGFRMRAEYREERARLLIRTPDHPANQQFLALLIQIRDQPSERVRPLVVNSEWHFIKQRCIPLMLVAFVLTSSLLPIGSTLVSYTLELYVRVHERLRVHRCARWHPEAVLIRPAIYLANPLSEQHERRAYELYDGSWRALWRLMFTLELVHLVSLNVASLVLKLLTLIMLLSFWSSCWTAVYLLSFLDKLAWLLQIKCQLEWCTRASRKLVACPREGATCTKCPANFVSSDRQARERLLLRLTNAFINYELYRRQHGPFRALTNFLLFQASLFTGACFLELYLVATNIENKFKFFSAFASACVIAFFNFYLVLASYSSKLIESIMHELIRMLATLAHEPELIVQPTVTIWRRQLLSEQELRLFTSMRVFTFFISYKQLVAFNAHLLGIWLLFFKVLGGSSPASQCARTDACHEKATANWS